MAAAVSLLPQNQQERRTDTGRVRRGCILRTSIHAVHGVAGQFRGLLHRRGLATLPSPRAHAGRQPQFQEQGVREEATRHDVQAQNEPPSLTP